MGRDSRLRGNDGKGVGSRFAGMTRRVGIYGDGAAPRLWRYGAEWIPAYAGNDGARCRPVRSTLSHRVHDVLSPL